MNELDRLYEDLRDAKLGLMAWCGFCGLVATGVLLWLVTWQFLRLFS